MKPISIRLTASEAETLKAFAVLRNTSVSTLLRTAAIKLAAAQGAAPRAEGTQPVSVALWPADIKALESYQGRNEFPTQATAVLAAMRVGLIRRGHLTLPKGESPDIQGVV